MNNIIFKYIIDQREGITASLKLRANEIGETPPVYDIGGVL